MSAAVENLNPKILDAADLPKRQVPTKPISHSRKQDIFDDTIFSSLATVPWENDPFTDPPDLGIEEFGKIEDEVPEPIDEQEIYDLISTISDPEHPITLGELAVVSLPDISITPALPHCPSSPLRKVTVLVTPTITHCTLATVIGLGIRVRLENSLPTRFRVDVRIKEGTHNTAEEQTKQISDKERVAAAAENAALMGMVDKMLSTCK